ncbi:hypothetical protein L1987_46194 [Smallanthus sonchifolius]|uniref:Uncharacterized protein n=1 Tax=Smallanthus sonchifolius TaxID=185202 RepID=A0ACB9FZP8_9ASTR|nr:hypothetical protein L1987_46194 [Smallanthus sonchifolius]
MSVRCLGDPGTCLRGCWDEPHLGSSHLSRVTKGDKFVSVYRVLFQKELSVMEKNVIDVKQGALCWGDFDERKSAPSGRDSRVKTLNVGGKRTAEESRRTSGGKRCKFWWCEDYVWGSGDGKLEQSEATIGSSGGTNKGKEPIEPEMVHTACETSLGHSACYGKWKGGIKNGECSVRLAY